MLEFLFYLIQLCRSTKAEGLFLREVNFGKYIFVTIILHFPNHSAKIMNTGEGGRFRWVGESQPMIKFMQVRLKKCTYNRLMTCESKYSYFAHSLIENKMSILLIPRAFKHHIIFNILLIFPFYTARSFMYLTLSHF